MTSIVGHFADMDRPPLNDDEYDEEEGRRLLSLLLGNDRSSMHFLDSFGGTFDGGEQEEKIEYPIPKDLASWLPEMIGRESMTMTDMEDIFVLIQLISIISPASVDLAWYASDEAMQCADLRSRNEETLLKALDLLGVQCDPDILGACCDGSAAASCEIARLLKYFKDHRLSTISDSNKQHIRALPLQKVLEEESLGKKAAPEMLLSKQESEVTLVAGGDEELASEPSPTSTTAIDQGLTNSITLNQEETTKSVASSTEDYYPREISLIFGLRWLLGFVLETLGSLLPEIDFSDGTDCLDVVIERNVVHVKANIVEKWKLMAKSLNPFYESIHCAILDGLQSIMSNEVKVEDITKHLRIAFPNSEGASFHPYDLEDALTIWMNTVATAMRKEVASSPYPVLDTWTEVDDLSTDLRDGRALCILATFYHLGDGNSSTLEKVIGLNAKDSEASVMMRLDDRISNLRIFLDMFGKENSDLFSPYCCWLAEEFAGATFSSKASGDAPSSASSNSSHAIRASVVSFLVNLFKICSRKIVTEQAPKKKSRKVSRKDIREVSIPSTPLAVPANEKITNDIAAVDSTKSLMSTNSQENSNLEEPKVPQMENLVVVEDKSSNEVAADAIRNVFLEEGERMNGTRSQKCEIHGTVISAEKQEALESTKPEQGLKASGKGSTSKKSSASLVDTGKPKKKKKILTSNSSLETKVAIIEDRGAVLQSLGLSEQLDLITNQVSEEFEQRPDVRAQKQMQKLRESETIEDRYTLLPQYPKPTEFFIELENRKSRSANELRATANDIPRNSYLKPATATMPVAAKDIEVYMSASRLDRKRKLRDLKIHRGDAETESPEKEPAIKLPEIKLPAPAPKNVPPKTASESNITKLPKLKQTERIVNSAPALNHNELQKEHDNRKTALPANLNLLSDSENEEEKMLWNELGIVRSGTSSSLPSLGGTPDRKWNGSKSPPSKQETVTANSEARDESSDEEDLEAFLPPSNIDKLLHEDDYPGEELEMDVTSWQLPEHERTQLSVKKHRGTVMNNDDSDTNDDEWTDTSIDSVAAGKPATRLQTPIKKGRTKNAEKQKQTSSFPPSRESPDRITEAISGESLPVQQNHPRKIPKPLPYNHGLLSFPIPESVTYTEQRSHLPQRSLHDTNRLPHQPEQQRAENQNPPLVLPVDTRSHIHDETISEAAWAKVQSKVEERQSRRTMKSSVVSVKTGRPSINARQTTESVVDHRNNLQNAQRAQQLKPSLQAKSKISDASEEQRQSVSPVQSIVKKKKIGLGPESQSNRKIIKNALMHVCLAGTVNEKVKKDVLEDLNQCMARHFIILFRGSKNHAFRGLYSLNASNIAIDRVYSPRPITPYNIKSLENSTEIDRIHGAAFLGNSGPDTISTEEVLEFYKYDCGSRCFKLLPTQHFSKNVHAIAIRSEFGKASSRPTF
ncbi:Calmodulin-regulated spectrin-associated protein 1 [Phlyctochytrium planicorne]|nr:Calmodulin-regulated spectrin-associated protein 1 [Phlyctochytrium planicorne]